MSIDNGLSSSRHPAITRLSWQSAITAGTGKGHCRQDARDARGLEPLREFGIGTIPREE